MSGSVCALAADRRRTPRHTPSFCAAPPHARQPDGPRRTPASDLELALDGRRLLLQPPLVVLHLQQLLLRLTQPCQKLCGVAARHSTHVGVRPPLRLQLRERLAAKVGTRVGGKPVRARTAQLQGLACDGIRLAPLAREPRCAALCGAQQGHTTVWCAPAGHHAAGGRWLAPVSAVPLLRRPVA